MDMEKTLPKVKGYIPLLRRLLLMFYEKRVNFNDFGFYTFLLLQADWDSDHSTFGCVRKSDIELAFEANCDPSTIHRRKHELKNKGLLEIKDGVMKIISYEKFTPRIAQKLAKLSVANLQEDIAQTQSVIAEVQKEIADTQDSEAFGRKSFKSSFKGNSPSEGFTDEEMDRIAFEIDKQNGRG